MVEEFQQFTFAARCLCRSLEFWKLWSSAQILRLGSLVLLDTLPQGALQAPDIWGIVSSGPPAKDPASEAKVINRNGIE